MSNTICLFYGRLVATKVASQKIKFGYADIDIGLYYISVVYEFVPKKFQTEKQLVNCYIVQSLTEVATKQEMAQKRLAYSYISVNQSDERVKNLSGCIGGTIAVDEYKNFIELSQTFKNQTK